MKRPIVTSACILAFALSLSFGALAGGQNEDSKADSSKMPASKTKTTTTTGDRNRLADSSTAMVGASDQKFMMDAAKGGMMEVHMGQMGQQKASSDKVKEFAKKLEADHTQANKELMDLAKLKNVSLPANSGSMEGMMGKMSTATGAAFDKAYLKDMVKDHKKDVKEFEREANIGMDSDVKAFAAKTLPTLKEHLRMAEELEKSK